MNNLQHEDSANEILSVITLTATQNRPSNASIRVFLFNNELWFTHQRTCLQKKYYKQELLNTVTDLDL
jgi:hypothetical protein